MHPGPARVWIIRHGEKAESRYLPDGKTYDRGMTSKGYERAAALAVRLSSAAHRPDFLFAAADSARSARPRQTLLPLSKALHLPLDIRFSDYDEEKLAHAIMGSAKYRGKAVLVCWRHKSIPPLARLLGAVNAPLQWPERAFDRVWALQYSGDGSVSFTDHPQKLLFGDSDR